MMTRHLGTQPPISTLSLPVGRYGTARNFAIISCLDDSKSVVAQCEDPGFGDFRWSTKRVDTNCGWKRRYVHDVYCPNGVYISPRTGRKIVIFTMVGVTQFINTFNLYDPVLNPGSNRTI